MSKTIKDSQKKKTIKPKRSRADTEQRLIDVVAEQVPTAPTLRGGNGQAIVVGGRQIQRGGGG